MGSGAAFASGLIGLSAAQSQASLARTQADIERQNFELNRELAEQDAEEAKRRGQKAEISHRKNVKQLIGKQRTALAAQGIEIDADTAAQLQAQTEEIGEEEAQVIRNNAAREAFGFKSEASQLGFRGRIAQIQGREQARSTLLTGGLQAVQSFATGIGSFGSDVEFFKKADKKFKE